MTQRIFLTDDVGCHGATPAHDYCTVTDMETILNDISRDLIPTGTGVPFPVVWPSDFPEGNNPDIDENLILRQQIEANNRKFNGKL